MIFALLAQYHAGIPHVYKYRIATSASPSAQTPQGFVVSDKSTTYLLAAQLALAQFPGSTIAAVVGWLVGYAWRNEILPGGARWRVPRWVTGKVETATGRQYEGLRRRLEGESSAAGTASAVEGDENRGGGVGRQRRTLGTQIMDQFRGAF